MPSRRTSALGTFLLILALLLVAPAAKAGDDAEAVAKIQELNRTAMLHFDDLNFALAEKALLEAVALIERAGLTAGPAVLSTHGNLAVLYSDGLKQPDKAVLHFKQALALKPDLKLSRLRSTPDAEANLARAKAEAGVGGAKAAEDVGLHCPTMGEIHAGDEITFTCTTEEKLEAAALRLQYKANDGEDFQALQMTKEETSGGVTTWVAKVPGSQTQARSIPFFIAAIDASGATMASFGREESPNRIEVRGTGVVAGPPPVTETEDEDEEEEYEEEIDDENPLAALERERWREHQGSKGSWLFSFGAGSGMGYAYGKSTEAFGKHKVGFNPGIAPASLGHLVWEVAYFVGRKTALSVGGRHQGIFGGPEGTATGAHSVLVRSLFFTEEDGKTRWYFALVGGGGEGFRMTVSTSINDDVTGAPTGMTVKDTVRGGPFVAGAGGGMLYRIGRRWHLSLDTQFLGGFPNFSAVLDLTGGVRWQY